MREKTRNQIRSMTISGLFIALGIVLPLAFHAIPDGGKIFLPMVMAVLFGALFLPWQYALAVGIITPLLSNVLTGMPPIAPLPMNIMMAAELGVAALVTALLKNIKWIDAKGYRIIFALIPALILGFAASGAVLSLAIQFFSIKGPKMWPFVIGAITTGLPGIAIQLVILPILYSVVKRRQS